MPDAEPCCAAWRSWLPDWATEYDTGPPSRVKWPKAHNIAEYGFCAADINPEEVDGNRLGSDAPGCLRARHNACCPAFERRGE